MNKDKNFNHYFISLLKSFAKRVYENTQLLPSAVVPVTIHPAVTYIHFEWSPGAVELTDEQVYVLVDANVGFVNATPFRGANPAPYIQFVAVHVIEYPKPTLLPCTG